MNVFGHPRLAYNPLSLILSVQSFPCPLVPILGPGFSVFGLQSFILCSTCVCLASCLQINNYVFW